MSKHILPGLVCLGYDPGFGFRKVVVARVLKLEEASERVDVLLREIDLTLSIAINNTGSSQAIEGQAHRSRFFELSYEFGEEGRIREEILMGPQDSLVVPFSNNDLNNWGDQ
jgi:hypothetical protein